MIVTCERCSTQFHLDDERVPDRGVRVRCSRCKYAFRVEPPAASDDERVHRAAARGLEPDTPEITQDLADEEEDWEFNDDRPAVEAGDLGDSAEKSATAPDGGDPAPESEVSAAGAGEAYGFGAETASEPAEAQAPDPDAPLADSGLELDDRSGSVAPLASEPQSGLPGSLDLAEPGESASGLELEGGERGTADLEGAARGDAAPAPRRKPRKKSKKKRKSSRAAGTAEPPAAAEEIGSPDQWDFFAAKASEDAPTSPRIKVVASPPQATAPRSIPRGLVEEDARVHPQWLERIGSGVGWLVVAALFAVGLHGGFAPRAHGSGAAAEPQRVANLKLTDVDGRWVDNMVAGDLYVVTGVVRRDATAGSSAEGGLFLTLLDARGERLELAPIPVGSAHPEALLRRVDPADLHAAGETFSPQSGAAQRIEAVVPALPARASAFRFVTAGQLAAHRARAPAPQASPGGADAPAAFGETLPAAGGAPQVRPEEPTDAP